MPYSLKDAATATGTSKPTILRAIQKGKVSAEKDEHGEWKIDPAELHRVYPPVTERTIAEDADWNDTQHPNSAYETGALRSEVEQLRERLGNLDMDRERERQQAADQIADLRKRLDQSEQERRSKDQQLTALLTDQSAKKPEPAAEPPQALPATPAPGLWGRLRMLATGKP